MNLFDFIAGWKTALEVRRRLTRPEQESHQVSVRKKTFALCMYEHTYSPITQSEGPIHDS